MSYDFLSNTKTADKWNKIGKRRRAGIAVPLFSIYSDTSVGIGEITDIKLLVDWCNNSGISIIQLLPLNDVGYDFAPYNSVSTFALDPMYISLNMLSGVDLKYYIDDINDIRKRYRPLFGRVNYAIKRAKLGLMWKIFQENGPGNSNELDTYVSNNGYWLREYALYKVLTESLPDSRWELWNESLQSGESEVLFEIEAENAKRIRFFQWLQWQLYEQMKYVKKYADSRGVLLMGDLPFLVSRESADVWSHKNYFRLDLSSGAPPDMYFASGQKWGMPPYNWDNIANDGFIYVREKLKYAGNFYDMYRIDHFVGLFRVWTSAIGDNSPAGSFLPHEEHLWELHGRTIIDVMLDASSMLPCAEDLGTVPECSYRVLSQFGIPGIDFQRYMKSNFQFRGPGEYRPNSCVVISTHDSALLPNWWKFEAGTIDEKLFDIMFLKQNPNMAQLRYVKEVLFDSSRSFQGRLYWKDDINSVDKLLQILHPLTERANDFGYLYLESFGEKNKFRDFLGKHDLSDDATKELSYSALKKANEAQSIFSIQLLQEYLCLDDSLLKKIGKFSYRINTPGKVGRNNWSVLLPISLNKLMESSITSEIHKMLEETSRL